MDAISVCDQLDQNDEVKRKRSVCLTDLADALREQGKFAEARLAYQDGLKVDEELKDLRGQGVTLCQLGTLAMRERRKGWVRKKLWRLSRRRLHWISNLANRVSQAVDLASAWHGLQGSAAVGRSRAALPRVGAYQGNRGDLAGAARTWNQLAIVSEGAGKSDAAEMWYRKAIEGFTAQGKETLSTSRKPSTTSPTFCLPSPVGWPRRGNWRRRRWPSSRRSTPARRRFGRPTTSSPRLRSRRRKPPTGAHQKADLQTQAGEYRRLAREAKRNFSAPGMSSDNLPQ